MVRDAGDGRLERVVVAGKVFGQRTKFFHQLRANTDLMISMLALLAWGMWVRFMLAEIFLNFSLLSGIAGHLANRKTVR